MPSASHRKPARTPRIVGAGLVTLDIVLDGVESDSVAHWAGGTCGNVLAALAFLGWHATPIARLGDDAAADTISGDLASSGVSTDRLSREVGSHSSRIAQHVIRQRNGGVRHRFSFSCPTCGTPFTRFRPPRWEQYESITERPGPEAPDVFFFDRVSSAILAMAETFRREGSLIYFEPSGIGRLPEFRKALDLSHIVKYSRDRLHSPLAALGGLSRLSNRRPRVEIETQGADGLRFRINTGRTNGWRWRRQAAFEVTQLRDTAGAGDWCSAGTLLQLGWTRGSKQTALSVDALDHALTFGQALAALNCQHMGPRSVAHVFGPGDMLASAAAVQNGASVPQPTLPAAGSKVRRLKKRTASECRICLTA